MSLNLFTKELLCSRCLFQMLRTHHLTETLPTLELRFEWDRHPNKRVCTRYSMSDSEKH